MKNKKILVTSLIVVAIFLIGLFVRLDYIRLSNIPADEKEFYLDESGTPYMVEFGDSHYHYRLTKNFLDHNYLGDTIVDGTEWDLHSYSPPGVPMEYQPFIIYVTAYAYKLVNLFADVPLMKVCFWIPMIIGSLAGIIAYFFTGRFINQYGAAVAGILTATSPLFVFRTLPGFFDTDMFILIFQLAIIWFYIEALQNRDLKKQIIFAVLSGLFMFCFSIAWIGWYYLFFLILVFSIGYLIYGKIKKRSIRNAGFVTVGFTLSFLLVSLSKGLANIYKIIFEPAIVIKMIGTNPWSPWPNIYSTVTELQKSSLSMVLALHGILFFVGLIGIIYMARILLNKKIKKHFSKITWIFYSFLLTWTILSISITAIGGDRFILLFILPLNISTGIMVGILLEYPKVLGTGEKSVPGIKKLLIMFLSIVILLSVVILPIYYAHNSISKINPRGNDDLWEAAEWINNNTVEETLIISKWGYGHFFTAIADRPVMLDGRMGYTETLYVRNNNPAYEYGARSPGILREYWFDRALATDDELLSYNIFRMLASSGDSPSLMLEDYTGSVAISVEILNLVLESDKASVVDLMTGEYGLTAEQAETIAGLAYPDMETPFVVVSMNEIRDLDYPYFKFGEWDFTENSGQDFLYSIEPYEVDNNILTSDNGIEMDLETGDVKVDGKAPYSLELISGDSWEKSYISSSSDSCVVIFTYDEKAMVFDKRFEDSVFVKLFIERSGTDYLEPLYMNKSVAVWE